MDKNLVMSVPDAGAKLGLSKPTAYLLAKKGVIPTIRLGHKLVVPVAAFERMLDNAGTKSDTPCDTCPFKLNGG